MTFGKKIASLVLTAVLALSPMALADVQRGDRGSDVTELQTLLLETGWLFEEPDGIFGGNTEQAVMEFQHSMGLDVTGVADETTMNALRQTWSNMRGEAYGGDPAFTPDPAYNACHIIVGDDGHITLDYCETHVALLAQEAELLSEPTPANAAQVCGLWLSEIDRMYDAWMDGASDKLAVLSARMAFHALYEQQRETLSAVYVTDALTAETQLITLLKNHAISLCAAGVEYDRGGEAQ